MTKKTKPKKVTAAAVSAFLRRAGFRRSVAQGAWPASSGFSVTAPRAAQYPYEAVPGVAFVWCVNRVGSTHTITLAALQKALEAEFTVEVWGDGRLRVTPKESA